MKTNYFKIGIFVLFGLGLLGTGIVILGAGYLGRSVYYFETYFDESISGLTVGSVVEVRGVRMGEVKEIGFLRDAYDLAVEPNERSLSGRYIRVVFATYPQKGSREPLDEYVADWLRRANRGLRVRLSSNIITGQAILEGTYVDPNRFQPIKPTWTPRYPYIPSMPSELTNIKDSIDRILTQLQVLDVNGLVSTTKNLMVTINKTVGEANVPALSEQAKALFAELRETNKELQELFKGPPNLVSQNIPQAVIRLNDAIGRINAMLVAERPQIDVVMSNLIEVAANLKELTETLKHSPSELIRSTPPPQTEAFKK
jgi:phospholipid/cholesterol/gamma-HCH transport system substrate-binding protein